MCDALFLNGIVNTILDHGLKPLRERDVIAGRCLSIKWHSLASEIHLAEEERRRRTEQ